MDLKTETKEMSTAIAHTLLDHIERVLLPEEWDAIEAFKRLERLKVFADAVANLKSAGLLG